MYIYIYNIYYMYIIYGTAPKDLPSFGLTSGSSHIYHIYHINHINHIYIYIIIYIIYHIHEYPMILHVFLGQGVANPGVPREIAIPHDLVGGLIGAVVFSPRQPGHVNGETIGKPIYQWGYSGDISWDISNEDIRNGISHYIPSW